MKLLSFPLLLSAIAVGATNDHDRSGAKSVAEGVAQGGIWIRDAIIVAPVGIPHDSFGAFVALRDGVGLVGSNRNVFRADYTTGVFSVSSTWADPELGWVFYPRVALARQGSHLLACIGDQTAMADLGAVRVHSPATPSGRMEVIPGVRAHTGFASEIRVDGNYMVVCAPDEANGRVYLFERRPAGWTQLHVFHPPVGWDYGGFFGNSADVLDHPLGLFVAIGGALQAANGGFVYRRTGSGFTLEATLPDRDHNGLRVRLGAGDYPFVVTGPGSWLPSRTNVRSFHRSAGSTSPWIEGASIQSDENIGLRDVDGSRVALAGNARVLVYESLSVSSWAPRGMATGTVGTDFGSSVALDGDMMLVGAPAANDHRGLAYLYYYTN